MATPSISPDKALEIRRIFQAPREKVFRAWTEAEELNRWFGPTDEHTAKAEVDLRVGGKYRFELRHSSGAVHTAFGEYREILPPEKLVFTWSWEDGSVENTLVTIDFLDTGSGTEIVLTHELFPSAEWRDKHNEGWSGCIGQLEKLLRDSG